MAEVKLPEIGEGIASGDVLEVLVKEGDTIKQGQGIVELETDKATIVVDSTAAGKITKIHVGEGDTVKIGQTILTVEAAEGAAQEEKPAEKPPSEAKEQPKAEAAPKKDKPDEEQAAKEDAAQAGDEGTTEEVADEQAQPVAKKHEPPRDEKEAARQPRQPAAERQERRAERAPVRARPAEDAEGAASEVVPASPSVRRFAREVGVNLEEVSGTGEGGRITREDVLEAVRRGNQATREAHRGNGGAAAPAKAPPSKPFESTPQTAPPGEQGRDAFGPVRVE
jgi:pyruvate dehydrogenase E2 component (dihydrolipoamide acetyltransferase)